MGNSKNWLESRARHKQLIEKAKRVAAGGLVSAVIIGPLIYFGVVAVNVEQKIAEQGEGILVSEEAATPEIALELPATPEVITSETPIEFPIKKPLKEIVNPKVEFTLADLPAELQNIEQASTATSAEANRNIISTLQTEFAKKANDKDIEIKVNKKNIEGQDETLIVMQNLEIPSGPNLVKDNTNADSVARVALRRYLKTNPNEADFDIYKDTKNIKNSKKTYQLVVDDIKSNTNKWYVTFQQYKNAIPIFDGNVKIIFTEDKRLIAITDNIRTEIPEDSQYSITSISATESTKQIFEWDEEEDEIEFINKGYYQNKPVYKIDLKSYNPLGDYEVFVNGSSGEVLNIKGNIRLADEFGYTRAERPTNGGEPPYNPFVDKVDPILYEPGTNPAEANQVFPSREELEAIHEQNAAEVAKAELEDTRQSEIRRSEIFEKIIAPVYAEEVVEIPQQEVTGPSVEIVEEFATLQETAATPEASATAEPGIVILESKFSQVLGKIYPQNPSQQPIITPFANAYAYINTKQITTDKDGYFENNEMDWYSVFLDGPYVTVYDDDASSNVDIKDRSPEDPFIWDENSASLAAINAFYHANEMHDYFVRLDENEINKKLPITVNSELVDQYLNGCGAWFDNSNKSVEMGRGGTSNCPEDLNYALSSDFVYHEYSHFIIEEITHLPNIAGSETAAMGEGLADYFSASKNYDSVWGDVVAPNSTRNLKNTLNYQTDMSGESHHDGQIFAGALWDLRTLIGPIEADRLIFNALYQDRLHFETFMYGLLIEDDNNNDFSDGTPHMLEIIAAFENHGIGPGITGFEGLPIDPEAWTALLGEEAPTGEEDSILNSLNTTCLTYDDGSSIWIDVNVTCYWTGSGTRSLIYLTNGADLYISDSVSYGTLSTTGDTFVYGTVAYSTINIGFYDTPYGRLTVGDELLIINGGKVDVGWDSGNGANINTYLHVNGSTQIYKTASSYTSNGHVNIINDASSENDLGPLFIGRTDTSTSYFGNQCYLYNSGRVMVDYFNLANSGGYINNYGYLYRNTAVTAATSYVLNGTTFYNRSGATMDLNTTTISVQDASLYDNDGTGTDGSWSFNDTAELNIDNGTISGVSVTFNNTSWLDLNGGTISPTSVTFNTSAYADMDGGTLNSSSASFNNATYADTNGTADFSPTNGYFYTSAYISQWGTASTTAGTMTFNGSSRWNHYGGTTTITNLNINDTSDVRVNTSGVTLSATNITLNSSGILRKEYFSAASNGDGNVSATSITLNNTSQLRVMRTAGNVTTGSLTVNSTAAVTNGSVYQTAGTISVTGTALLDTDASLYNIDGGGSTFGTLKMDEASEFQNDGSVNIGAGGARIGCVLTTCDGALNYAGESLFTNNYTTGGSAYVTLTTASTIFLNNTGDFINNTGGYVTATSVGASLDVTDVGQFDNYGNVNVYNMRVGWHEVDVTEVGGWYHNYNSPNQGYTDVDNEVIIYRGDFYNSAGPLTSTYGVNVDGNVDMEGLYDVSACDDSLLTNFGEMYVGGSISMHDECNEINNQTSGSLAYEASLTVNVDIIATDRYNQIINKGNITIGDDLEMTSYGSWIENNSDATDTGVINVDDDFNIYATHSSPPYLDNYGEVYVFGSASTQLYVALDSYINNYADAIIEVDTAAPLFDYRGIVYIYNNAYIDNSGTFNANRILVGNAPNVGGELRNNEIGTVHVYYSGTNYAMMCYRAWCMNDGNTVQGEPTDGEMIIDGELRIVGVSGDPVTFYNKKSASIRGIRVYNYATMQVYSNSTLTLTGTSYIFDDNQPTPGNDGLLDIWNGSTVNGTSGNLQLGISGSQTGGEVDNHGSFIINTLTMYESSAFNNYSDGDFTSNTLVELAQDEPLDRTFTNEGAFDAVSVEIDGDNAWFNNENFASAIVTITGHLEIDGGRYTNKNTSGGTTVDTYTNVLYQSGTYTQGELYNYNFFTSDTMYVSGYVQNGSSLIIAQMDILSTSGTEDLHIFKGGSSAGYGKFLNHFSTLNVGDATGGQIKIEGSDNFSLPGTYHIAEFQNSQGAIGGDSTVNAHEIYVAYAANFTNYSLIRASNKFWTGANASPKNVYNYSTGDIAVTGSGDVWLYDRTYWLNDTGSTLDAEGLMKVMENAAETEVANYSNIDVKRLYVGDSGEYKGGDINNYAGGDIDVNAAATSAGNVYYGSINLLDDSDGFDVVGKMTVSGLGFTNRGYITANSVYSVGIPTTTFGELEIKDSGSVVMGQNVEIDNSGGMTGNLTITGTAPLSFGRYIQNYNGTVPGSETATITIDGATNINNYGSLTNYAPEDPGLFLAHPWTIGGVQATGLVTVDSTGRITSDTTSQFNFKGGLTTAGTVSLQDHVRSTTYTQTGGTSTFGDPTNVGLVYLTDKLTVSGGVFKTYNYGDNVDPGGAPPIDSGWQDIEITGATTEAYFENDDGSSGLDCFNDVHGYFDILGGARAIINCATTDAMVVHAGSPGGTTLVEGGSTLVINTNLETDDMIVGGTGNGTVTHDPVGLTSFYVPSGGIIGIADVGGGFSQVTTSGLHHLNNDDRVTISGTTNYDGTYYVSNAAFGGTTFNIPVSGLPTEFTGTWTQVFMNVNANTVFDLTVNNDLTINSNGALDVSKKSNYLTNESGGGTFAGTYGGRGNSTSFTGVQEYGYSTSPYDTTIYDFWHPDYGSAGVYDGGVGLTEQARGGGKMKIYVGGNLTNNGNILANGDTGQFYSNEASGSGGGIAIWVKAPSGLSGSLSGSGSIEARGGNVTPTSTGYGGGGGRIYIDYYDKSGYTGNVSARGGAVTRSSTLYYAGSGTIYYRWRDPWENQRRGTLVIKGPGGSNTIDIDLDGAPTDVFDAYKFPLSTANAGPSGLGDQGAELIDVDSLQIEDQAVFWATASCGTGCAKVQQCILESGSFTIWTGGVQLEYNSEHTSPTAAQICYATPDPPESLVINNSISGTSGGTTQPSNKTTTATIADITPAFNATYTDGELDSDPTVTFDSDFGTQVQIQIANTMTELWEDDTVNHVCTIDNEPISATADDNVFPADEVVQQPPCTLVGGNTYFWRMRIKDNETLMPGWGMWSQTGQFFVEEGGTVALTSCGSADLTYNLSAGSFTVGETLTSSSAGAAVIAAVVDSGGGTGTLTINTITDPSFFIGDTLTDGLGNTATATSGLSYKFNLGSFITNSTTPTYYGEDICTFESEATVDIKMKINKSDFLTHSSFDGEIGDMERGLAAPLFDYDFDSLTGLDGLSKDLTRLYNESGFYVDLPVVTPFTVATAAAGVAYDAYFTYIPDTATDFMTSSAGYSTTTFDIIIGAFIHGIHNPPDPTLATPTNPCYWNSNDNGTECITKPGDYSTDAVITLSVPAP